MPPIDGLDYRSHLMETGLLFLEDRMRCALLGMSGRRSLQLCVLEGAVCAVGWQKGERVRLGMAERGSVCLGMAERGSVRLGMAEREMCDSFE